MDTQRSKNEDGESDFKSGDKSPEQSSQNFEEDEAKAEERRQQEIKKIQLPCSLNPSALSAHVKVLAEQIIEIQKKDPTLEKQIKKAKEKAQQSGEQSKSSGIVETEEELHTQKVCQLFQQRLKDNTDWVHFVSEQIEPLCEMEKGQLCKD